MKLITWVEVFCTSNRVVSTKLNCRWAKFIQITKTSSLYYLLLLAIFKSAGASEHDDFLKFQAFEPNYIIYGENSAQTPESQDVLFQFSFAKIVFDNESKILGDNFDPNKSSVWFTYTQKSILEVNDDSAPINNTDYMPSIFYQGYYGWSKSESSLERYRAGWRHRSNGQDESGSRSWDVAFIDFKYNLGTEDYAKMSTREHEGGRHSFSLRGRVTLNKSSNNQKIEQYLGNVVIGYHLNYAELKRLSILLSGGKKSGNGNINVQLSLPGPDNNSFLAIQKYGLVWFFDYRNGFDESIVDFNKRSWSFRGGIRFDM